MEQEIKKTKVYNVIIMDRSGSMWEIQKPAIMGYNEVLGGVKAAATKFAETQEQFMTLVLFDSSSIDEVYWNANPADAAILTEVVVTIITDGYENDSHEYNLTGVKSLIEHLKKEGWSFAYMGTDHDVEGVTVSLSITNVVKFEKTEAETLKSFKKERHAREMWSHKMDAFNRATPCATMEERVCFNAELADEYYDEEPKKKRPKKG